jgi:hypothetical protein
MLHNLKLWNKVICMNSKVWMWHSWSLSVVGCLEIFNFLERYEGQMLWAGISKKQWQHFNIHSFKSTVLRYLFEREITDNCAAHPNFLNFSPEGCSIYVLCLIKNSFLAWHHLLVLIIEQYAEMKRMADQSSFVCDRFFFTSSLMNYLLDCIWTVILWDTDAWVVSDLWGLTVNLTQ